MASEIKAASLLKQSAQNERLPRLSLAGGWSYQGLRPATSIPAYQYGAYLQVPLFTGGRIGAEVATRDIEVRKLTEAQRQVRDRIGYEVRTAATRLDSARTEVEAANLGVTLAREGVTQAQDRFRAGVANNIEVITAQNELVARQRQPDLGALSLQPGPRRHGARDRPDGIALRELRQDTMDTDDRHAAARRPVREGDTRNQDALRLRAATRLPPPDAGLCAVAGIGALVLAAAGASAFIYYDGRVSTDDAQVDAHIAPVAPKVAGTIAAVLVDDNQTVKAGPGAAAHRSARLRGPGRAGEGGARGRREPGARAPTPASR